MSAQVRVIDLISTCVYIYVKFSKNYYNESIDCTDLFWVFTPTDSRNINLVYRAAINIKRNFDYVNINSQVQ